MLRELGKTLARACLMLLKVAMESSVLSGVSVGHLVHLRECRSCRIIALFGMKR